MNLQEVLPNFRNKADLARNLGVTRQAVNNWQRNGGELPKKHELLLKYEILPNLQKS